MLIKSTVLCPACREVGVESRLKTDPPDTMEYFCEAGHKFDSLDDAEAMAILLGASSDAPPAQLEPTRDDVTGGVEVRDAKPVESTLNVKSMVLDAPPSPSTFTISTAAHQKGEILMAPKTNEAPNGQRAMPEALAGKVIKLPNGAMILPLRVPDQFAGALVQAAENHEKPLLEYVQEIFEFALENQWFA